MTKKRFTLWAKEMLLIFIGAYIFAVVFSFLWGTKFFTPIWVISAAVYGTIDLFLNSRILDAISVRNFPKIMMNGFFCPITTGFYLKAVLSETIGNRAGHRKDYVTLFRAWLIPGLSTMASSCIAFWQGKNDLYLVLLLVGIIWTGSVMFSISRIIITRNTKKSIQFPWITGILEGLIMPYIAFKKLAKKDPDLSHILDL